jgi:hypothetical protein
MSQLRAFTARIALALAATFLASSFAPCAHAQVATGGPTLLVVGRVSADADASIAGEATEALRAVARERGYTIVALSAPLPHELDLSNGASLHEVATQVGVDRVLHLYVFRDSEGYGLHLGLGSRDGSAPASLLRLSARESVAVTLADMARGLVPAPGAAAAGVWVAPPVAGAAVVAPVVPPAPAAVAPAASVAAAPSGSAAAFGPPAATPVTPRDARPRRDRTPLALTIAGAAVLGGGWVLNIIPGVFAGNDGCGFTGCSPESQRWTAFRATSLIPLIGPWIQMGVAPNLNNWWPIWLAFDGLVQTAGFVMLVYGLAANQGEDEPATPELTLLPMAGPEHTGLLLTGTF